MLDDTPLTREALDSRRIEPAEIAEMSRDAASARTDLAALADQTR